MLEQVCPDCDVPIMRSRKKEEICCVCETDYQRSNPVVAEPTEESQINSSSQPPNNQNNDRENIGEKKELTDSDAEYENLAKEYEQTRGVKLPSRHAGSTTTKFVNKARSGLPR